MHTVMGMPMTEGMGMPVAFITGTKKSYLLGMPIAYGYSHRHVNDYTRGVLMTLSTGILGILNVVNLILPGGADLSPPSRICVYACVYAYTCANFF